MKKLEISIAGSSGTGKTTAAIIIERALRENGFQVTLLPTYDGDQDARRMALSRGEMKMEDVEVHIAEVQLRLGGLTDSEDTFCERP